MAVPGGGYGVGQGPQVTIRQIKKDSVDFVLSNVDLAYPLFQVRRLINQIRKLASPDILAELPTVGIYISKETDLCSPISMPPRSVAFPYPISLAKLLQTSSPRLRHLLAA